MTIDAFSVKIICKKGDYMLNINYSKQAVKFRSWEDIKETMPDVWSLKMLEDMEQKPEFHDFIPREDVLKELHI